MNIKRLIFFLLLISVHALPVFAADCEDEIYHYCHKMESIHNPGFTLSVSECTSVLASVFAKGKTSALDELNNDRTGAGGGSNGRTYQGGNFYIHYYKAEKDEPTTNLWNCANQLSGSGKTSATNTDKKKSGCDAPPNFRLHTEIENVDEKMSYCMAYVKNDSPYPITCHLNGRSVEAMPDDDHLAEGWPIYAGQDCRAEIKCEKDRQLFKKWCK